MPSGTNVDLDPCRHMASQGHNELTHLSWVMHICVRKLTTIASDNSLSMPSHYLNQCWNIVNWKLGNKFQWNRKGNSYIFIQQKAVENIVCKMETFCLGLNVLSHQVIFELPITYGEADVSTQAVSTHSCEKWWEPQLSVQLLSVCTPSCLWEITNRRANAVGSQ